jgi:MTH538 TIR-like domain (DUF1863).
MSKSVFFSFQYEPDNWRVQQVMQMGAITEDPAFTPQDWETVRRSTDTAIENWIDKQMLYTKAIIVLVGATTYESRWVRYEIIKAWNEKRPLLGVRIHGLLDKNGRQSSFGKDPFELIELSNGENLSQYVQLVNPNGATSKDIYNDIRLNLENWVQNLAYKRP